MMRLFAAAALGTLAAVALPAQGTGGEPRVYAVRAGGDSVLVYVLGELPPGARLTVLRAAGGAADTITAALEAARDPLQFRVRLGEDYEPLRLALRVADEAELQRRISSDAFTQSVTAALSRGAALALGRLVVDATAPRALPVEYTVQIAAASGTRSLRATLAATPTATAVSPQRVSASADAARIALTWSAGTPTWEREVGYHVYRSIDGGPLLRLTPAPIARLEGRPGAFDDLEVREGASYRYEVRGIALGGREGPAAVASLTVRDRTPPDAPREVAARRDAGRVLVVWTPSAAADVAGYHVERAPGLDRRYTRLTRAPVPRDSLTYADTTVALRQQHFWRVVAVDRAGNESKPSNAASGFAEDTVPPAPPGNLTGRGARGQITLSWTPSPSRDVRGYHVYRGDDSTRLVRLTSAPHVGRSFTDSASSARGLRPGATYVVRVTAVDSTLNESAPVTIRVPIPDDEPPAPPSGIEGRNVDGRYVEVEFSASPSDDVRLYRVVRRDSAGPARDSLVLATFDAASGSPWMLRDTTALVRGRTYAYGVTAVDSAGNVGAPATTFVRLRDIVPPPSVRFAAAELLPTGGVRVRWERVVDLELAGYHVYRSNLPTGTYERLTARPVADLNFVDARGDATSWYVIRAVDASGNESAANRPVRGRPQ